MKQEDKDLLLKDLCGRLPYKVKIHIGKTQRIEVFDGINLNVGYINNSYADIRPYLFPLSSITEEQYNSLYELGILDNCNHSYDYKHACSSSYYHQCIPYNDETKHLVGTTKDCPEYYKTW